jgi:hypothetical protein
MTITITALVIAIAGLVLYLAANGKPSEVGRIMLFCGLLVALSRGIKL